ncbi:MAG: HlyD family efflux transporter periplasmic adaptor subunit [Bacteroidales bacterium]|nr:HlyD family efflux transporter periplasmic adaptor subunit [Bacteroidales bacterium]MBN2819658.1 HlyD family efflux transporter periplasmic adaptor subunit [Bacteroidales bacterium]
MNEKEKQKFEIRSSEVQELLGQVPAWIVRWGTITVLFVLLLLFVLSKVLSYPDIIPSQIILTANIPPAELKAYTDGPIKKIMVSDNQQVEENQILAVIHSSADYSHVLKLDNLLSDTFSIEYFLSDFFEQERLNLGNVQSAYASFINVLEEYKGFVDIDYYQKKALSIQNELFKYNTYINGLTEQQKVLDREFGIVETQYKRDSLLAEQGVLSKKELEKSEADKLNKLLDMKELISLFNQTQIQISSLEHEKLELELQLQKENKKLFSSLKKSWEELKAEIDIWEKNYVIVSPFNGKVSLSKIWSENQYVKKGDVVLYVLPEDFDQIIGRVSLKSTGSGKVKENDKVIIRFDNYPYLEYGVVTGKINTLSLTPDQGLYYATVLLDSSSLITNHGVNLTFSQNMQGSAEIITESRDLLERIVAPLRSAIEIQEIYKE